MPRKINYPPRGLNIIEAEELIEKLYKNGSSLKIGTYASIIGMSEKGGAFRIKLSSLSKYGLIEYTAEEINITELARNIINAYNEEERKSLLFKAFKNVPLFEQLIEKFIDTGLDLENLDKILIREYDVGPKHALSIKKCIINSLDYLDILNKETGNLDENISWQFEKEKLKNTEHEEKEQKQYEMKSRYVQHSLNLGSEILVLILFFASHLESINMPLEDISNIIENNENLTHTKLVFEILKDSFQNESISQDNIKKIIEALRLDLKINE